MSRLMLFFLLLVAPALALVLSCLGLETSSNNPMGWVILVFSVSYMAGSLIYFWRKKGSYDIIIRQERGDRSFWLILPGFLVVFFGSPLEFLFLPERIPRLDVLEWIGMILLGAGVLLRFWTRLAIRGMYSGHIQIKENHQLVKTGPYGCLRHPGYAGYLLMALGIGLAYSSWIGLVAILFLMLPGLEFRMKVEEKLLEEHFGEEFQQYKYKTKKIIPWIW